MTLALTLLAAALLQSTPTALTPTDVTDGAEFGRSVAIQGDRLIIGAPGDSTNSSGAGSAHLYERDALGVWIKTATFRGSFNHRSLGTAVAIDGDLAAASRNATFTPRRLKVMERLGGAWQTTAELQNPAFGFQGSSFGGSLQIAEGRIVVADYTAETLDSGRGTVHVYEKAGGAWTLTQSIVPPAESGGQLPPASFFGTSIALEGHRLAVGESDYGGGLGRVTIWGRRANQFVRQATIPAPAAPGMFRFGGAGLSLSGDRLAVASASVTVEGLVGAGMVFLFERQAGGWVEIARIPDPDPTEGGRFGSQVALRAERLVVGRYSRSRQVEAQRSLRLEHFVEVSGQTGAAWVRQDPLPDPLEAWRNEFGDALALDGDDLVVAAQEQGPEGVPVGVAYVGDVSAGWQAVASIVCGGGPCACDSQSRWIGCFNSWRRVSSLTASGTSSISADDLALSAAGLVPSTIARLAIGRSLVPGGPFGDGRLCIADPRLLSPVMGDGLGRAFFGPGLLGQAALELGAAGMVTVGETWIFQVVYDDTNSHFWCPTYDAGTGPGGNLDGRPVLTARGFNLTSGIQVTIQP